MGDIIFYSITFGALGGIISEIMCRFIHPTLNLSIWLFFLVLCLIHIGVL